MHNLVMLALGEMAIHTNAVYKGTSIASGSGFQGWAATCACFMISSSRSADCVFREHLQATWDRTIARVSATQGIARHIDHRFRNLNA